MPARVLRMDGLLPRSDASARIAAFIPAQSASGDAHATQDGRSSPPMSSPCVTACQRKLGDAEIGEGGRSSKGGCESLPPFSQTWRRPGPGGAIAVGIDANNSLARRSARRRICRQPLGDVNRRNSTWPEHVRGYGARCAALPGDRADIGAFKTRLARWRPSTSGSLLSVEAP
jgi:hypothetical protein